MCDTERIYWTRDGSELDSTGYSISSISDTAMFQRVLPPPPPVPLPSPGTTIALFHTPHPEKHCTKNEKFMVVKAFCCHGNIDCSRTSIDVRAEVFASMRSERGEWPGQLDF